MDEPDSAEYKWLAFPLEKKLELMASFEHMETLMEKQIALRRQLRNALLHKWMTHDQSQPSSISFTEKTFLQFVKKYYKCVREEAPQFEFQGHQFLTAYARYVIEYLEPKMVAMSTSVLGIEHTLTRIRKHHDIGMKLKEDPNYDPPAWYHPDRI